MVSDAETEVVDADVEWVTVVEETDVVAEITVDLEIIVTEDATTVVIIHYFGCYF